MSDSKPLDINELKNLVKLNAPKTILSKNSGNNSEALFTLALALTAAIKKIFYERAEAKFSQEPIIDKKPIIQFVKRMRIDAMEKFNQTTIFSVVHYYKDVDHLERNLPIGCIIIYIEKKFVPELLRLLKYPYIDYDDEAEVKDGCGAISNLIAGQFKKEFIALGYKDLEMSHFKSFINNVQDGIDFPKDEKESYEIGFHIDGIKRMVVDMVMADLPKV